MRDAVVNRQFQHLGIDHDEPALVGAQPVQERQDHRVDGDRLARAGRARDEQMRHAREIDDDGLAADRLAERDRKPVFRASRNRPTRSSSRRNTVSRVWFGSSMPIALRPCTTATRAEIADIERAMSSASPMTRDDLMPGAGSSS